MVTRVTGEMRQDYPTLARMVGDQSLIIGAKVSTDEHTTGNGGGGDYLVVADANLLTVPLDNGLFAELRPVNHEVTVEQFGAIAYDMWLSVWPGGGVGYHDSRDAINRALATGYTVLFGYGTYRSTGEIHVLTHAQRIKGQGAGPLQLNMFAGKQGVDWRTRILWHGSPTKYVKTRRQARITSAAPNDVPMVSAWNNQAEYTDLSGIFFDLECDYTNTAWNNLGADYDHGFFSGTWTGVHLYDIKVRGYFRQASFYLDNTRMGPDNPFVSPDGVTFLAGNSVNNGTDKFRAENIVAAGGHKGLFIAGPKYGNGTDYYDSVADAVIADSRGGYGTSDYLISQSFFGGPDHHSARRRYDPPIATGGTLLDPAAVDIDAAAGAFFYDSRQTTRQSRRVKFDTCRFTTIEAIRIFIGNGLEIIFDNPVTESLSSTVGVTDAATGLVAIDQYDYDLGSFKDIACFATDYAGANTGARRIDFLHTAGTPRAGYFQNIVPEHTVSIQGNDPAAHPADTYECNWAFVAAPTTSSIEVSSVSLEPLHMVQVVADWTGLDITDVSVATLLPNGTMEIGDTGVLRVDQALSTGITFGVGDIIELRVDGQSSANTRLQLMVNGVIHDYRDGALLADGRLVANGILSDSGL